MSPWLINYNKLAGDQKKLGKWGEREAEKFLHKKALKTLTKNFSAKTGEIDLVMVESNGPVVFIEVKTRTSNDYQPPENAINFGKMQKLRKTAKYFIQQYNLYERPLRFDAVTVILNETGQPEIEHYQNIFTP